MVSFSTHAHFTNRYIRCTLIYGDCSFLLSPLAVKRDIAVTILLRCIYMRVCMHACLRMSIRVCLGHNSYIHEWISKLFYTVFVLGEEKCNLKHCLGRLKVKVTLEGQMLKWS